MSQRGDQGIIFGTKALRSFGDGMMSIAVAQYALALGLSGFEAGVVASAALVGTSITSLLVGRYVDRVGRRRVLIWGAMLAIATGLAYAGSTRFALLVVVAFAGTVNPTSGDVSSFLPVEQSILAQQTGMKGRVRTFAWFNVVGALAGATGALFSGVTEAFDRLPGVGEAEAVRLLFLCYSVLGIASLVLTSRLTGAVEAETRTAAGGLGPSKGKVYGLSALFAVDSFGGGLVVQSIVALYLLRKFDLDPATTGAVFFGVGLLSAASFLVSARLAGRFGLVNTMVFTHLPSNAFLAGIAFAPNAATAVGLLLARGLLSQMDVPARQALVVSVVEARVRPAAAATTGIARSISAAFAPAIGGALLGVGGGGAPFVLGGVLKAGYDLVLLGTFGKAEARARESRAQVGEGGGPSAGG